MNLRRNGKGPVARMVPHPVASSVDQAALPDAFLFGRMVVPGWWNGSVQIKKRGFEGVSPLAIARIAESNPSPM